MAGTKASQMRAAATATATATAGADGNQPFNSFSSMSDSNYNSNPNLTQSVNEMKMMRAEAQQKRMDWAKRRGQFAEGDIMRAPGHGNRASGSGNGHADYNQDGSSVALSNSTDAAVVPGATRSAGMNNGAQAHAHAQAQAQAQAHAHAHAHAHAGAPPISRSRSRTPTNQKILVNPTNIQRSPARASVTLQRVNSNGSSIRLSPPRGSHAISRSRTPTLRRVNSNSSQLQRSPRGSNPPPPPPASPTSSPTGSMRKQETINLTREQLEQIIQDRVASTTQQLTEYQNKLSQQRKQIDDLKFFQELDAGKANTSAKKTNDTEMELNAIKSHLHKTLTENSHLSQQIGNLKHQNIDLQANLQACNPPMSSPDAYKKALRLQSDVLDAKNLLQEESLRRERAETNLECVRIENESQIQKKGRKLMELKAALEERGKDLDDGLNIMKSMEEEMSSVQSQLHEEHALNQDMKEKYEMFEKEKNALADKLRVELESSKGKLEAMEERFDREKGELEDNCDELMEEIDKMKVRAKEMEEKRKTRDKKMKELEKVELEQNNLIQTMKKDHEEEVKALKESLEEQTTESKDSKEKITAMEEVVAMYHEKARAEIEGYAARAEEANQHETAAREELQECLSKVDDAEKEIDSLLDDMTIMKNEYDEKEQALEELKEKHNQLSETFKANTSVKARDHQHMREKKKWTASEKQLREELSHIKKQSNQVQEESKLLLSERDEFDTAFSQLEEENRFFKTEMTSMEADIEEFSKAEEEYMSRTKSLEHELVRLQNMTSRASPTRMSNAELEELQMVLRSKDQEIERVQKMADAAMSEVKALKRPSHPSPNATPRMTNASPTFDAFNADDDEVQRLTSSLSASPSQIEWDEMDNAATSRKVKSQEASSSTAQLREMSSSLDFVKQERHAIENDAIRSYMRHRRRQKRHS